jgi:hypothetical protein
LNDTDLALFLDTTWSAFDGLISEQESWIQHATTDGTQCTPGQSHSHTQAQCESLFPKLAKLLLEGNNHATIASKTSDDDCEMIRLISEILYRRQLDLEAAGAACTTGHDHGTEGVVSAQGGGEGQEATKAPAATSQVPMTRVDGPRNGQRATFEDYCTMQSNEMALFRQQIKEDLDLLEHQESDRDASEDGQDEKECDTTHGTQPQQKQKQQREPSSRKSKHDTDMAQWRQLLSILPNHLLSCFYVYLRIRDAYLLLARENTAFAASTSKPDTQHQQHQQQPTVTLTVTSTLFRTILYREVANSFGIRDASDEILGFAVFPRACFFNHSCCPNILKKRRVGLRARQMEFWSTELIQEGEECCINYGDILAGVEERKARLESMYFFHCSCPRCLKEEAEK